MIEHRLTAWNNALGNFFQTFLTVAGGDAGQRPDEPPLSSHRGGGGQIRMLRASKLFRGESPERELVQWRET